MKFICDVHIAFKLVNYLKRRGCECYHVNTIFTDTRTADKEIAKHADENGLIVITKDQDFRDSYILSRTPKKLVKLNTGNSSTQQMIDLFENNWSILVAANQRPHFFIESDIHHFYFIEIDD
jgi:predicted nuclease of predicted toxin-antitoxin system